MIPAREFAFKEWAIPLGLAFLAFTGLWWAGPAVEKNTEPAPNSLILPFDYVFVDPTREGGEGQTFLLGIWNDEVPLVGGAWLMDKLYAIRGPATSALPLIQKSPFVVALPAFINEGESNATLNLNGKPVARLELAAPGPRLMRAGYNATAVTAYIFDSSGQLLFTNAPAQEAARFDEGLGSSPLPSGVWYLGHNATTPEGTHRLPTAAMFIVNRLRPLLDGLPVGGVATTQSNDLLNLYGPLHVTVRIDSLVYAP